MTYVHSLKNTPATERWGRVRQWMEEQPLPFYTELRRERPILQLPGLVLVSRFDDCMAVLSQHERFTVALYKPKQAGYWMAEDETPRHWREKGVMQAVLDREDLPRLRAFASERAAQCLDQAGGRMDAVPELSRAVPVALVQEMFGYDESDPAEIRAWSFWNQFDAFYNQPFHASTQRDPAPETITAQRQAANQRMGAYLKGLLQRRAAQLAAQGGRGSEGERGDPATRLLRLSQSGAVDFDIQRVARNVGGLLIGTIETTSQAVIHALSFLLADPERREEAVEAAQSDEETAIDGHVMEALRFHPPFPYFFRMCEQDTLLGLGTAAEQRIAAGTTVLTLNHSAMFDPSGFVDPHRFDPERNQSLNFLFGHGHHACLGRHIGAAIIPAVVRQVLRRPGLQAAGPVDRAGGPFPEHFPLTWGDDRAPSGEPAGT
ncbi:MAG: cytochrome P450 [Cyanobacteriota bacterium]|nr:cytochrome P450 [Cyanobacteriota bacterium]